MHRTIGLVCLAVTSCVGLEIPNPSMEQNGVGGSSSFGSAGMSGMENGGVGGSLEASGGSADPGGPELRVDIAPDTPVGRVIAQNSCSVPMLKLSLTAVGQTITVDQVTVAHTGIGNTGDLYNSFMFGEGTGRLTLGRTFDASTSLAVFRNLNFSIPVGTTRSVSVYADYSANTGGGEHMLRVTDPGAIVLKGAGTVTGWFPPVGNMFTVGNVSATRVDVKNGDAIADPRVGDVNVPISSFTVTAVSRDIVLERIALTQSGTGQAAFANIVLYEAASRVSVGDVDGTGRLNFALAQPIAAGTAKAFQVHADILGGTGKTIRTYVEYATDVVAVDQTYQVNSCVCMGVGTGCCAGSDQGSFDGTAMKYAEVTIQ